MSGLSVLGGAGGGTFPRDSWNDLLFQRASTDSSHSDDDEFSGTGLSGWTEVDPTGTTTWTEEAHVAAVQFQGQSAADLGALVKAITSASAPMTIETAVRLPLVNEQFTFCGLVFTDGTATTSNAVFAGWAAGTTLASVDLWGGTLTNMSSGLGGWIPDMNNDVALVSSHMYFRLIWVSANTWSMNWSTDGINWSDDGVANQAHTLTPTHFGLAVSKWGGSVTLQHAAFEYFRVYDSDLSV